MAAGDSKLKPPHTFLSLRPSIRKYTPNLHPVLEALVKYAARMAIHAKQVVFPGPVYKKTDPTH